MRPPFREVTVGIGSVNTATNFVPTVADLKVTSALIDGDGYNRYSADDKQWKLHGNTGSDSFWSDISNKDDATDSKLWNLFRTPNIQIAPGVLS